MMWGGGWWIAGLIMAAVMVGCMWMMGRMMIGHTSSSNGASERQNADTPEHILANRLASGEIDVEEYERRRDALRRTRGSNRTSSESPTSL
jgi:uncharacterized membrane protein